MTQIDGFTKGCEKGSRKGSAKGSRNPGLSNSNATAPCNATTTHLNTTQLQQHLKPRRGLEESKTYFSSRVPVTGLSAMNVGVGK